MYCLLRVRYRHQVPLLQQYSSCWVTLHQLIIKPPPATSTWIHHQLQFPLQAPHLESETPTRLSPEAHSEHFSDLPKLNNTAFPDNSITASCNAIIVFNINILLLQLNYFRTFHWAVKCFCFSSQFFIKMTQTVLLRGRKCISFSKWQVRSVVISSEERWVLKCLFEPWGPIKKGEEMTLFSLHHNSNFLGLVPPALWRDPGHCAGGRRGKTEWITHPGKTDVQCGVFVFHTHTLFL